MKNKILFFLVIFLFVFGRCGELTNKNNSSVSEDFLVEDNTIRKEFSSFIINEKLDTNSLLNYVKKVLSFLPQQSNVEAYFSYGGFAPDEAEVVEEPSLEEIEQSDMSEPASSETLFISVHLLDAYPPYDDDPHVKGAYTSKENLQKMIEERSIDIYRKIFKKIKIPPNIDVEVGCRHGVRATYVGSYKGASDKSMILFSTRINGEDAVKVSDWTKITDEEIRLMWEIKINILPYIQLQSFYHY